MNRRSCAAWKLQAPRCISDILPDVGSGGSSIRDLSIRANVSIRSYNEVIKLTGRAHRVRTLVIKVRVWTYCEETRNIWLYEEDARHGCLYREDA